MIGLKKKIGLEFMKGTVQIELVGLEYKQFQSIKPVRYFFTKWVISFEPLN